MTRPIKPQAVRIACLLAAGTLLACSPQRASAPVRNAPSSGRVVTHDDIARTGATNAWDAVRRAGSFVQFRESTNQDRVRITSRGAGSLMLSNQILFVVDGVLMSDHRYLESIPAVSVRQIEILSATRAALRFGAPGGNGAVVVTTMIPAS